jgi:hypothetical protein
MTFPIAAVKSGVKCAESFRQIVQNCGEILEIDRCG